MKKNSQINIVFMGTPDFAVPYLDALLKSDYLISAVVTQPDKPAGRKKTLTSPPVKKLANEKDIQVLQPKSMQDESFKKKLAALKPDILLVVAYGKILPEEILLLPKIAPVNVHASLLPLYRGASPIQAALLNGAKQTGITIQLMSEKMDEGDIIAQKIIAIDDNDNAQILYDKLAQQGAQFLLETLPGFINGRIIAYPQDDKLASYCKKINKEDGQINWKKESCQQIINKIRAFTPWPSAYFLDSNKKRFKIIEAQLSIKPFNFSIGEFFIRDNSLFINCADATLEIKTIQPESKKIMTAQEFIRGRQIQ